MAPTRLSRSAVPVVLKVLVTESPVRAQALLESLSSPVTLYPRVALRHHYQASLLKINSTMNFNGGFSTSAPSSMVPQKNFLYV